MKTVYKIDKDIPPPDPPIHYPFKLMDIGDSFHVPCDTVHKLRNLPSVAQRYGKRNGTKYRTRKENKGLRIWRIA